MGKKYRKNHKKNVNYSREDYHHLCFQRKHWEQGWAKILREHPYTGGYIPQATLHRELHSKIHDVPVPNGKECREAVEALNRWLANGMISLNDPLDAKLDTLIEIFDKRCPATVEIFKWQKEVVQKFYGRYKKEEEKMYLCKVIVEDERLLENLVTCTKILGYEPTVEGTEVSVVVNDMATKLFELYHEFGTVVVTLVE